jgi:exonuclease III
MVAMDHRKTCKSRQLSYVNGSSNNMGNKNIASMTFQLSQQGGKAIKCVEDDKFLKIFHQNACGLASKVNELSAFLSPNYPQLMCFTEHHLKEHQINRLSIDNYHLGASYCRKSTTVGGICIFVHKSITYSTVHANQLCKDKSIEACKVSGVRSCILTVTSDNFQAFLTQFELIINKTYNPNFYIIICGDFNVNYLTDNEKQLNSMLQSYHLISVVDFPTRITIKNKSLIDNIFIDLSKIHEYCLVPIYSGLSDHDT